MHIVTPNVDINISEGRTNMAGKLRIPVTEIKEVINICVNLEISFENGVTAM